MKTTSSFKQAALILLQCLLSTTLLAQAPPVITSFFPLFGPVGTTVTIVGSNFTLCDALYSLV